MFTVCPKCALTLVVTAADLRIAQGYVRCGRCLNVFNALARLSEERPSAAPDPVAETTPQTAPRTSPNTRPAGTSEPADLSRASAHSSLEEMGEIEMELDASFLIDPTQTRAAAEETAEHEAPAEEEPLAAAPAESAERAEAPEPSGPAAQKPSGWREHGAQEPTALTESPPQAVATDATASLAAEPDDGAERETAVRGSGEKPEPPSSGPPAESTAPSATEPSATEAAAPALAALQAQDAQQTNISQEPAENPFERRDRPRAGLAWTLGAGALAIALALQIVNHYRDALAADPMLKGPLSTVYSALGVKLVPHWNIHAYDVRQLGASVAGAAAGEIIVRASVKNAAPRPQPLPLLRVTLQDRFGNSIAARDVPPTDYLPSSATSSALLAAGGRVDATMVFVDPGPQAAGFEIDVCLRQRGGDVACAHGPW